MAQHFGTIRKYTAALLDLFNGMEIEYKDKAQNTITRSIPITYSSKEKSRIIEGYTAEQLAAGNTNVLPRASLSISTMVKLDQRIMNKNNKINTVANATSFDFMYNSVPYEFTFELSVMCRGMNEAAMIIEQVAPKFNPIVNIDIWDGENLDEPTSVPVKLLDIGLESEDYEEMSTNIVIVSFGLSLTGNLYPPIQSIKRIKDFKIYMNQQDGNYYTKKSVLGWDVASDGTLINATNTLAENPALNPPIIIDIVASTVVTLNPVNNLTVIYKDNDNKLSELTFTWVVLLGSATIASSYLDNAVLNVTAVGTIQVRCTIQDIFGNSTSLTKTFIV